MDLSEYKPYPKNTRYLVSKDGNVYSLKHKRLLKQILTKAGYKRVWIWDGGLGKMKGELVHRMVATTYIPNPKNKPHINHLDYNRSNNNVENLEWCTPKENNAYSNIWYYAGLAIKEKKSWLKSNEACSKKTLCIETGIIYKSCSEAARQLGISSKNISRVCIGKRKSTGGYHWKYV